MRDTMELYEKTWKKFGKEKQFIVAIEECAELQKTLTKALRGDANKEKIADGLVDVYIMCSQISHMLNLAGLNERIFDRKLSRLEKLVVGKKRKAKKK
jgi:NTP pyrophosphatase (non-canonical NTP hydrolase)